ncbi:hypothetical protein SLS53_006866 [Cytospora paraplurivora]|uniref:Uncharacterized protein n=1 Tax=Cytospora paraplurivora TaxID=2898453 RepID=A0AAN9YEA9_9PEZI
MMYAYIIGLDDSGKHVFYKHGASPWYYLTYTGATNASQSTNGGVDASSNNLAIEFDGNSENTVALTQYLSSGRVYIGANRTTFQLDTAGNLVEPLASASWLLISLDSFDLALGMKVTTTEGQEHYDAGLPAGSLKIVRDELAAVSGDWGIMYVKGSDGNLVRALAPASISVPTLLAA